MSATALTEVAEEAARPSSAAELLTARLDRLPMARTLWIMVFLLTLGAFFDSYAIQLSGALGPGLIKAQIFTPTTSSFFGMTGFASYVAVFFAGLFVAALCVSYVADRLGRRTVFAFALLWFGVANFVMGMQTTADGVNLWRFISALGVGLELVTVDAYMSELVPKRSRGQAFAIQQGFLPVSHVVVYFLAWQLIQTSPFGLDGWRWVAWSASIAAVAVWWIRLGLPESPRWLAQQGRIDEAEQVMSTIEGKVRAEHGRELPTPERPHYQDPRKGSIMEIFGPLYIRRTIMLVLFNFFQTVAYYGFIAWMPTLLMAKGIQVTKSLEYSLVINIAAIIFPLFVVTLFADRMERKWHAAASCVAIAVFGMAFGVTTSWIGLIVLGGCLAMAAQWLSYALHAYQAELYPTRIRARGIGFAYSWSRLSGILTPFFIAFFLRHFGTIGVFAFVSFCCAVIIVSVLALGPRTTNLEVEAIAH